jgi:hypothetical protein
MARTITRKAVLDLSADPGKLLRSLKEAEAAGKDADAVLKNLGVDVDALEKGSKVIKDQAALVDLLAKRFGLARGEARKMAASLQSIDRADLAAVAADAKLVAEEEERAAAAARALAEAEAFLSAATQELTADHEAFARELREAADAVQQEEKLVAALGVKYGLTEDAARKLAEAKGLVTASSRELGDQLKSVEDGLGEVDSISQGLAGALDNINPKLGSVVRQFGDMAGAAEAAARGAKNVSAGGMSLLGILGPVAVAALALAAAYAIYSKRLEEAEEVQERAAAGAKVAVDANIALAEASTGLELATLRLAVARGEATQEQLRELETTQLANEARREAQGIVEGRIAQIDEEIARTQELIEEEEGLVNQLIEVVKTYTIIGQALQAAGLIETTEAKNVETLTAKLEGLAQQRDQATGQVEKYVDETVKAKEAEDELADATARTNASLRVQADSLRAVNAELATLFDLGAQDFLASLEAQRFAFDLEIEGLEGADLQTAQLTGQLAALELQAIDAADRLAELTAAGADPDAILAATKQAEALDLQIIAAGNLIPQLEEQALAVERLRRAEAGLADARAVVAAAAAERDPTAAVRAEITALQELLLMEELTADGRVVALEAVAAKRVELAAIQAELHEEELDRLREQRAGYSELAGTVVGAFSDMSQALAEAGVTSIGTSRKLAAIAKASAIFQIQADAAAGSIRQFKDLPFPAALATSIAIGAQATAATIRVAAATPSFAAGVTDFRPRARNVAAGDGVPAVLHPRETVLNSQQTQLIEAALRGQRPGAGAGQPLVMAWRGAILDVALEDALRRPGSPLQMANTRIPGRQT